MFQLLDQIRINTLTQTHTHTHTHTHIYILVLPCKGIQGEQKLKHIKRRINKRQITQGL